MRLLITTNKAVSHFRPMLPFVHGLKARGYEVRVAALASLSEDIEQNGLTHIALKGPTDEDRADLNDRASRVPNEQAGKFYMREFFMGILPPAILPELLDALHDWRPDLILRETTEFSGLIAAQKLGVRHARFEILNGESEESIASNYAKEISTLRHLVDLDPVEGGYLKSEHSFSAHPLALDDTPRINSQSPFRFRSASLPALTDTKRPDWLSPDDKPSIYMTFGTVVADFARANHVYRVGLEAVSDLPVNVLLTTGSNAPADLLAKVPPNVTVREFVPQAEVLPHVQLMVCHGGSGTVLGGLAEGVPMVIVPLFADQPDNARCLASVGLCTHVKEVDRSSIRAAISDALEDSEMRNRSKQAALDFAEMPTVEQALDRLTGL